MSAVKHKPVPEILERYSQEQLAELVEIAEKTTAKQREGRSLGSINNAARATTDRGERLEKAARLVRERPYLERDVDLLTCEILHWCRNQAQKKGNGKEYGLLQIWRELRAAGYKQKS